RAVARSRARPAPPPGSSPPIATTRGGAATKTGESGGDTYNCLLDAAPSAAISQRWASTRSAIQLRAVGVVLPQPIQFGKYTLFERIGRGGMADVFKARVQGPAGFERVFVVKRILPHLSDDPTFTKMFIEE